jgi:hypothetical protein
MWLAGAVALALPQYQNEVIRELALRPSQEERNLKGKIYEADSTPPRHMVSKAPWTKFELFLDVKVSQFKISKTVSMLFEGCT